MRPPAIFSILFLLACSSSNNEATSASGSPAGSAASSTVASSGSGGSSSTSTSASSSGSGAGGSAPACDPPMAYMTIEDRDARAMPAPPMLGPAGSVFDDPTFGSRVLRVTDDATRADRPGTSFHTVNEVADSRWNADGTVFVVQDTAGAVMPFRLDPAAFTVARIPDPSSATGGLTLPFQVGDFSPTDPDIVYGIGNGRRVVQAFDLKALTTADVLDLDTLEPGFPGYAQDVSAAEDGTLSVDFGGVQDTELYLATFNPKTQAKHLIDVKNGTIDGQPLNQPTWGGISFQRIDRSGRWVLVEASEPPSKRVAYLWDLSSATLTQLSKNPGYFGFGTAIGRKGGSDPYQFELRSLASPGMATDIVTPDVTAPTKIGSSISWANARSNASPPVLGVTYRDPASVTMSDPWRAWDDEVIAIATDGMLENGTSRVFRFAHTFNVSVGIAQNVDWDRYIYTGSAAPTGRYYYFTSDWGNTLGTDPKSGDVRLDVFLVELKPLCN